MLLMFLACLNGPVQGTAVGNPTGMSVTTAGGTDVLITSGSSTVSQVQQASCTQDSVLVQPIGKEVSLVAGSLPLTAGDWCTVRVSFSAPLRWEAQGPESRLHMALSVPELVVPMQMPVQGPYVLELGYPGWVDGLLVNDQDVTVQPGSADYDRLVAALAQSRLYQDLNRNGAVDSEDRTEETGQSARSNVTVLPIAPADTGLVSQSGQRQTHDSGEGDPDSGSDQSGSSNGNGNGNGNGSGDSEDDTGS